MAVPIQAVTTWRDPKAGEDAENQEVVYVIAQGEGMKKAEAGKEATDISFSEGETVKRVIVKTGISDDTNIVIEEGLTGERLL